MKYKLFSKRGLALIVSLMMCLSAMSTTAWAGSFTQLQDKIDKSEDGNVVLEEDYSYNEEEDGDRKSITINKEVDLNLNGWTITGSGQESVIKVSGKDTDLTIRNEKDDATESKTDENGELVTGQITGGAAKNGGGVHVSGGANLTLEGGSITGNAALMNGYPDKGTGGAGVYVYNGTFVMNGGEISHNSAERDAAGVELDDNAKFEMNGGTITGNRTDKNGGGVSVKGNNAEFEMNGGTITGNIATGSGNNISGDPQKVTLNGGTVTTEDYDTYGKGVCHENQDDGTCKVGHQAVPVDKVDATCTEDGHEAGTKCSVCNEILDGCEEITAQHRWTGVPEKLSTCTQAGHSSYQQCSVCGNTEWKNAYDLAEHTRSGGQTIAPTCTEAGYTEAVTCSECGTELAPRQEGDPANGHTWGDWGEPVDGIKTRTCEVCGAEDQETVSQPPVNPDPVEPEPTEPDGGNTPTEPTEPTEPDGGNTPTEPTEPTEPDGGNTPTEPTEPTEPDGGNTPDVPVLPETPELPDDGPDVPDDVVTIPDEDVPLGGEPAPAPVTIADEAVPLAGLLSVAQLLDELYRHEDRPAVVLPEGFPFASHEYAPAICWALDSALVVNTEAEPLDPDELLTVGLLRKVLTNYALLKGQEDFVVELTGEDDDLVLDLGERLTVFYAQLEAAE